MVHEFRIQIIRQDRILQGNRTFIYVGDSVSKFLQAENEPILSSFLYASILSHDCLEQALGFVLANRLHNPTLLATQLVDIFNNVIMSNEGIRRSIRIDIQVINHFPSIAALV